MKMHDAAQHSAVANMMQGRLERGDTSMMSCTSEHLGLHEHPDPYRTSPG